VRDAEDEQEEEVLEDLSVEQEEAEKIAERRGIAPGLVWIQDEVGYFPDHSSLCFQLRTEMNGFRQ